MSPWFVKMYESKRLDKWWEMMDKNELLNFEGEEGEKVTNML